MFNPSEKEEKRALCNRLSKWRFILRVSGFWPDRTLQKSIMCKIKGHTIVLIYTAMAILQYSLMIMNYTDLETAIGSLMNGASTLAIHSRLVLSLLNRSPMLKLMDLTGRLLIIEKNTEESLIVEKWNLRQAEMVKYLTIVYTTALTVWFTSALITKEGLSIDTHLPSYFYEAPLFHVIFFAECSVNWLALFYALTEDILITLFVSHLCGELACISMELKKIGQNQSPSFIKNIIKNHVVALDYGCNVRQILSTTLYFEMIPFMIATCIGAFTVISGTNAGTTASALVISFTATFRVFIICMIGEILLQESLKMQDAITKSNWYICGAQNRRTVQMILIQAQQPIHLRVESLGVIDLKSFGQFIFNAFSYLTVLRTVIKQ